MGQPAPQQLGRGGRVHGGVVDAVDHHDLIGHATAGGLGVGGRGLHDQVRGVSPVERHQEVAQRRPCRMQGDGQRVLRPQRGQLLDARDDAAGADGDVPGAQPERARVAEQRRGGQDPIGVQQRLAHAHEHDVRDPTALSRQVTAPEATLVHDLGDLQVTPEAQLARGAERAADRAAGLAGDAQRGALAAGTPRRVAHQHRLDGAAVIQAVERLLRQTAVRLAHGRLHERIEPERGGKLRADRARQRMQILVRGRATRPDVVCELAGAVGRLAVVGEPAELLLGRQPGQAGSRIAHARLGRDEQHGDLGAGIAGTHPGRWGGHLRASYRRTAFRSRSAIRWTAATGRGDHGGGRGRPWGACRQVAPCPARGSRPRSRGRCPGRERRAGRAHRHPERLARHGRRRR